MSGLSALSCTPATASSLAPNATMTCTAQYTVTQADVNAGSIVNTATVDSLDPVGNPTTATDSTTVTADQTEEMTLVKTASPDTEVALGQTITYTMVATNTGTTTVDNVVIADTMSGLSALSCTPVPGATLTPGAATTCTATYVVTQSDIDRGDIANTATVSGDAPGGHSVHMASTATVPTVTAADVTLSKQLAGVSGSVATWDISVENTGTTPYPGPITVTDALPSGLAFDSGTGSGWSCTGTQTLICVHAADLAIGTSSTVTVNTTITGEGAVTNTASIEVAGETVQSAAMYNPSSGFAFTGSDAERLGFLGLLGVLAGWFVLVVSRKRNEEVVSEG